ncbi:hypothetical protein M422DRAFT_274174 [Sphaerobolus stellatus SS14]|uniref:PUL domain-containing protein n=1 Tax=Sphaerobolus stellatus (strain SS14) TaxID=990650 RepID=A0A0C9T7I6_SPHS4|nr:hypothetical protein M422DRAFT_274174 [Sphaerobolus stellatus SS14]
MRNKTYQLNEGLKLEISTSALAISSQELRVIDQAFDSLIHALGNSKAQLPQSTVTYSTLQIVDQILQRWPVSQRFPVIDLARLLSAFYPAAYQEPGQGGAFFNSLLNAAEWSEPWVSPLPKTRETNTLLALRAVANGLQVPQGAVVPIPDWVGPIFKRLVQVPYESLVPQHRVVLATIAFNLSCIFLKSRPSNATQEILQQLIIKAS